ncbi:YqeB family protein [Paenibacillus glacialis]|uniref:50S ribosomal protein L29 n=1 Tax=Paenibacillus glacialis TaxID=494026 RepID=A0A168L445_9BACL|nr:hypothetical protein [Paenibacillus glacialis]OAB42859.1 hypothetical protein PGLA_10380 [Paenibacillus glacialis]
MATTVKARHESTEIGFSTTTRVLLFTGIPLIGIIIGYFLPALAAWTLTLPWIPFRGPIELITSFKEPWMEIICSVLGLAAGIWFALAFITETLVVTITDKYLQLDKDRVVQAINREEITAAFLDGKYFILLGPSGQELAREIYDLSIKRLASTLELYEYPFIPSGDPYKEQYRRWVVDSPDLPPAINALMKARENALHKKDTANVKDLRCELIKLGYVIREEEVRQYWRSFEIHDS